MTSLVSPSYTLVLGSSQLTRQVLSIEVDLELAPMVNSLTVTAPFSLGVSGGIGDPAQLKLNNGEKESAVFSGVIDSIRRTPEGHRFRAVDAGSALARYRPATTYEQVTAGTVIRNLCDDAAVDTGDIADGVALAYYVADPRRNGLDHVARVAGWSGAVARVTEDNKLESTILNTTHADVALKYGRELVTIRCGQQSSSLKSFTVAGESGAGTTSAPEVYRPTSDFFAGNRPGGPSLDKRWRSEPALRTVPDAGTAGAALQRIYNSTRERGRLDAFLQPELKPGVVLQIQDLPDPFPKDLFWIYRTRHVMTGDRADTQSWFYKGGDSFDPTALLGSLAGAIGSLL